MREHITALKDCLKARDERIENLKETVERLDLELQEMTTDRNGWGDRCSELEAELAAANALINAKSHSITSLSQELTAARQEIEILKKTYKCFNCGFETMNRKEAEAHFGDGDEGEPAICVVWSGLSKGERLHEYQQAVLEINSTRDECQKLEEEADNLRAENARLREICCRGDDLKDKVCFECGGPADKWRTYKSPILPWCHKCWWKALYGDVKIVQNLNGLRFSWCRNLGKFLSKVLSNVRTYVSNLTKFSP